MAESPLEKLRRMAAEKKAATTSVAQPVVSEVVAETASGEAGALVPLDPEVFVENSEANLEARMQISLAALKTEVKLPEANPELGPTSDHPLAMQFAELESALLATDPEFKTILRQIHKHLGNEPELVTQMTEKEIQMVVQGLIVFANAEIVAPAAAKSQAKKVKEAKAKVISADDL